MKNLTINNQFLSTSEFLIPSSTREYLPTNISIIYAATDAEEISEELYDFLQDNGIELIYSLNIKESYQAYNELLDQLQELLQSDFGDDDFEDYIPDLVNQILHIILYYNHNFPENHYLQSISKNLYRSTMLNIYTVANSKITATSYILI